MDMLDPILAVYNRIFQKYLQGKLKGTVPISLLAEIRRIQYALANGNLDLDEAKDYLRNLLDSIFEDEISDEDKNKIVSEFEKVFKIEIYRAKALAPRRGFG